MNNQEAFNGTAWQQAIKQLKKGREQMAALTTAIQEADAAGEIYWQLMFRYNYACEATFRDDPTKAMPVSAEFGRIYEEHPDALGEDGAEMYLMITQMGLDPVVFLPQISMQQWEALMEHFYALVKRYHIGLRTYWWQMARFWQYVDVNKAYEYTQTFWKKGRDGLSDCQGCERGYAVNMSLLVGDEKAAAEYGKPLKAGRNFFCDDSIPRYNLAYLEDAMRRGDLARAEGFARKLAPSATRDKGDLIFLGAVIQCFALTDLERAVSLVERHLEWTLGLWDQKKVFDFDKGAWMTFRELSKQMDTVKLELPDAFPLYREDGVYSTGKLAHWFHTQAADIADRFDRRNGSDYFSADLARGEMEPEKGLCG